MPARVLDVQEVVNAGPLSAFQKRVIALCFLVAGIDTAAIGFIAPARKAQRGETPAGLAPRVAARLFGLLTEAPRCLALRAGAPERA